VGLAETLASAPLPHPPTPSAGTLAALGLWVATVLAGLALFACVLLPGAFWALTGRSPAATARAFAQPLLMAFGTSTSAAALPLAMQASHCPRGGGGGASARACAAEELPLT
jgi:L-cystine uptake protein TcyP (sodium:dicarboxylate symporter family)